MIPIAGHWAEDLVKRAVASGFVLGYEDRTFRPDAVVTRAELAVMLSRALKLPVSYSEAESAFADEAEIPEWARGHIRALAALGLLQGYPDGRFGSKEVVTRVQVANVIVRALQLEVNPDALPALADVEQIPEWGRAHVAAGVQAGLFQGRGNNKFEPLAGTTRAEAVRFIMMMLQAGTEEENE